MSIFVIRKHQLKAIGLLWMALLLTVGDAVAQTLTARAPGQVSVGQQFRVQYVLDTQDGEGFRVGQFPDAFEVLMGPSTSTSSSFQIINGKTSHSSSVTYTYILMASKNGTFNLPAAQVTVDGKQIHSTSPKITVSGQAQGGGSNGGRQQGQKGQQPQMRDAGSNIGPKDLFIRVTASKKRVVEQEPVLLTYKVYTLVQLTNLDYKMPDIQGVHTQEVPLPQQKSFSVEQYNGRNYNTVTWSQYVMFPQMAGKLKVPSLTYTGVVVQRNRYVDPFEAFFNGGSGYVEVKKTIQTPSVEIQVDPLPNRPSNFSGGVGRFNVSATLDKTEVKANEPVTLRLVVSGVGNLKLIKQPQVNFPKDFDCYDPKQTDKTKLTTNGVEGNIVYDYLVVPRHQGDFEIPAVEFVYFDPQTRQYKTAKTEAFKLHVEKGEGGNSTVQDFSGQEDVQLLANDIRHIKLGDANQQARGDYFFGSRGYWLSIVVLLGTFVSLFVIFRKRAVANADLVGARAGKANKVATKRLKKAAKLMKENKANAFYDEVLRALWGYVGDKLNIPVEQLSQDNIRERLSHRDVDDATTGEFLDAIAECEFERYAPGDPKGNMSKVYTKAMTAIEAIEKTIKRMKN